MRKLRSERAEHLLVSHSKWLMKMLFHLSVSAFLIYNVHIVYIVWVCWGIRMTILG